MEGEHTDSSPEVEETIEYYRERAPQYADWAHNTGRFEGSEPDPSHFAEAEILVEALGKSNLIGDVLEIASGTGVWTEELVKFAASITALDSSPEMLERCNSRLKGNPKVKFVVADFYTWELDRKFDAVTFSFWISHVPATLLDSLASKISQSLKPMGKVFFVDQRVEAAQYETPEGSQEGVVKRTLEDGREFRIVKHFYSPEEIITCFLKNGIEIKITETPNHFFYASGEKMT